VPAGTNPNRRPGPAGGSPPSGFPPGCPEQDALPEDIPFRGARPIDVNAPRDAPARRAPAYAAAAASGAHKIPQRRSDTTGALRRIRDTGAIRVIMDTAAMRTLMDTTAMQILRARYAGRGRLVAIVGACVWGAAAVIAITLVLHG
jgi:hypothetical protein